MHPLRLHDARPASQVHSSGGAPWDIEIPPLTITLVDIREALVDPWAYTVCMYRMSIIISMFHLYVNSLWYDYYISIWKTNARYRKSQVLIAWMSGYCMTNFIWKSSYNKRCDSLDPMNAPTMIVGVQVLPASVILILIVYSTVWGWNTENLPYWPSDLGHQGAVYDSWNHAPRCWTDKPRQSK